LVRLLDAERIGREALCTVVRRTGVSQVAVTPVARS